MLSKNDIIALKKKATIANINYPEGQRFVVTKTSPTKTTIHKLEEDGTLSRVGVSGLTHTIALWFPKTGEKFAPSKQTAIANRGDLFQFKDEYNEDGIYFAKGARLITTKGGVRPHLETFYPQANGHCVVMNIHGDFIKQYLEKAEPIQCELTQDWSLKNIKIKTIKGRKFIEASICHKNLKIGAVKNDGKNGSFKIEGNGHWHKYSNEWRELVYKAQSMVSDLKKIHPINKSRSTIDPMDELIDFLIINAGGLDTLNNYLTVSVQSNAIK